MRSIGRIPHKDFRIEVYAHERYFYVEIEAGPMKQCYKFPKEKKPNLEAVQAALDEAFLQNIHERFNAMYRDLSASLKE